jgi:hypothetical protein
MLSSAFVDLATYSYPESIMYGNEYFNYYKETKFESKYYILIFIICIIIFSLMYFKL